MSSMELIYKNISLILDEFNKIDNYSIKFGRLEIGDLKRKEVLLRRLITWNKELLYISNLKD